MFTTSLFEFCASIARAADSITQSSQSLHAKRCLISAVCQQKTSVAALGERRPRSFATGLTRRGQALRARRTGTGTCK
jgi:hypothetical protein